MDYNLILERKRNYYGDVPAIYEFSADEYATRKIIQENISLLKLLKTHSHSIERIEFVINDRINELKKMINE